MEQLPGESEDLQPQDLSSTHSHAAIDLTKKGEECLLKTTSMEGLSLIKPPTWYTGSGSSKGLSFTDTDPEHRLKPGEQIQPDNAFSNTTVTLSYVSRSHVFSTLDSLSQHSSLYGVPSISRFSTLDGYLQHVDRPFGSAAQSERYVAVSPAHMVGESGAAVCLMQQSLEINGSPTSSNRAVEKYMHQQRRNSMETSVCEDTDDNRGLQNGRSRSSWSNSTICIDSSPEPLTTDMEEEEEQEEQEEQEQRSAKSEVLFLISRTEEPVLIQDGRSPSDLSSNSREYVRSLEGPVSPSAASVDHTDMLILPHASSSPSASEEETHWEELENRGLRLPGLSGEGIIKETQANNDIKSRSDISKDYQNPVAKDYQNPVAMDYQEPVSKGYKEPVSKGHQEPVSKGHQEPVSKGHQEPVSKGHQEPVSKGHQEPVSKGHQEPVSKGHQEPVSKGHQEPRSKGPPGARI
ncbi:hypothetical protein UPYG_G00135940 [Umbra pygmaea]|uniref:Uncharacterized protein n=1 Tax=Umbra pygmaea TaxID=75934 RepID=A0ABD0WVM9_UMBPY